MRNDVDVHAPTVGQSALYFATRAQRTVGRWDWEFRRASPEDGPSEMLTVVAGTSIPISQIFASMSLSPDGRQLAFVAPVNGIQSLWVRRFDQERAQPVPERTTQPSRSGPRMGAPSGFSPAASCSASIYPAAPRKP